MARIRYVKPELAKNEELYDAEERTGVPMRYGWAMLSTICDKAGRFDWRPRQIKADIFPYDPDPLIAVKFLEELQRLGMVWAYDDGQCTYGCVPPAKWAKHQRPHKHEQESCRPKPPDILDGCRKTDKDRSEPEKSGGSTHGDGDGERNGERGVCASPPAVPVGPRPDAPGGNTHTGKANTDQDLEPIFAEVCAGLRQGLTWGHRYVIPAEQIAAWLRDHPGKPLGYVTKVAATYLAGLDGVTASLPRFANDFDKWAAVHEAGPIEPKEKPKPDNPKMGAPSAARARGWCPVHPAVGLDADGCSRCRTEVRASA